MDNMTNALHMTEQAVIPEWVEKEDKNERILKLQRLREGKQPNGKEAAESGDDR